MLEFIKGFALSEDFFITAARPIIEENFPSLVYSAGLLGYGSDVLGYDDEVSTDHMWGPRFYLFLPDLSLKQEIMECFSANLPAVFRGYNVNFSEPDEADNGVRHAEVGKGDRVSPLIFIYSFEEFLREYLGTTAIDSLTSSDWLAFSEHRLLALSKARFYADGLHLGERLKKLACYPDEPWYYLLASNWSLIAEEQAFVKRTATVGDDLGSRIICARIAERLMRLCFLYSRRYAPYSKWFGTAFAQLPYPEIKNEINKALSADNTADREDTLVRAQKLVAELHNSLGVTQPVDIHIQPYFDRDIKVIYPDKLVGPLLAHCPTLAALPLIGTMSEVANFTALSDHPVYRDKIRALY